MPSPPRKTAKLMAQLYVNGPEGVRGNWNAAARAAGYKRPPRRESQVVNDCIREVQGEQGDQGELQALLGAVGNMSWEELAERARPVMAKVAAGVISASSAQLTALREIINRGEGKVGHKAEDISEIGVVLLPVLGSDAETQICPVCRAKLTEQ